VGLAAVALVAPAQARAKVGAQVTAGRRVLHHRPAVVRNLVLTALDQQMGRNPTAPARMVGLQVKGPPTTTPGAAATFAIVQLTRKQELARSAEATRFRRHQRMTGVCVAPAATKMSVAAKHSRRGPDDALAALFFCPWALSKCGGHNPPRLGKNLQRPLPARMGQAPRVQPSRRGQAYEVVKTCR
jgi:hypothetical protein